MYAPASDEVDEPRLVVWESIVYRGLVAPGKEAQNCKRFRTNKSDLV